MKVLVISPTPSHPQNAGNRQRIFALLQQLKQFGHEVHFCFIRREWVSDDDLQRMEAAWDRLTLLPYDRRLEARSLGAVFGIDDWFPPGLAAAMEQLAREETPDVVIVEYVFYSKALEYFSSAVLKIIDTHDVFSDRHLRLQAVGLQPSFFYTTREEEARGLDRADLVLAIQDEERAELQELTRAAVLTVGFVPPVAGRSARQVPDTSLIGYLGSGNPLNLQSVQRCLDALDPARLRAARARLRIGGGASAALKPGQDFAESVGTVEDPGGFYEPLALAINPHEGGTGLKIKTVEALSYGVPVIGTREAFLGLEAEAVFHAASSPAEVAGFVMRFVEDAGFREEVTKASRRLFERYRRTVEDQLGMFRSLDELRRRLSRPRALLVTDIAFWQESLGNHARIAELIRAARSTLDLDVFILRTLSKEDEAPLKRILGARGQVFSFKSYPGAQRNQPVWIEASSSLSGYERKSFSRQFFCSLEEHLQDHKYDGVIIEYIRLSFLRHVKHVPAFKIIDTHDVMSMRISSFSNFGIDHFIKIKEEEELKILSNFDVVLAIQAHEYNYLSSVFPHSTLYLPHAMSRVTRQEARIRPRRIIFVGGDSPMNRDGLNWFLAQVWPCIRKHGVELHVAGDVCNTITGSHHDVVRHGRVDDLQAFLLSGDIAINPIYYGGGLKIKTVEYLSYGIPSVLTVEAAFGIPDGAGDAYLLARSRADYIDHLEHLIGDPGMRRSLSERAYEFGRRIFGSRALRPGLAAMTALLQSARPPARG